jgi:hypothetical protein
MHRRGRTLPAQVTYSVSRGNFPDALGYFREPQRVISDMPEEWRDHAWQPWRILFPDLEWAPLSRMISRRAETLLRPSEDS